MNIALPAIIVFILLLPGFIFRSSLKRAERVSVDFSPFGRVVAEAVLWAIGLHAVGLTFTHWVCSRGLDPVVLMNLLSSVPAGQASAGQVVGGQFNAIAAYIVALLVASHLVPICLRTVISRLRLDRADAYFSSVFRFHHAPWYYLLSGADFKKDEIPDFILVSAIVEVANGAYLYIGVLDDFHFDSEGQLDRLILQKVSRRPIADDKPPENERNGTEELRFYPIDGDNFVLRYSEAITLNVQYVKLMTAE